MKKILILLGPPGAGKGTVGSRLGKEWGLPLISSGDILRENLKRETPSGLEAKRYMESGELVPDEIVMGMIRERLVESDCKRGFIIDGFPRTSSQARMLDKVFDTSDDIKVIYLKAEDDFLVERLSLRRVCEKCGKIYHLKNLPPAKDDTCDICEGRLVQRADDREEIIRRRLEVYRDSTVPLIEYYNKKNILHVVHGDGVLEETLSEIKKIAQW